MGFNPTGGLRWHWKAWRAQQRWAGTRQQLAQWLARTTPAAERLCIIGSSAGWMLDTDWLARFQRIDTWDIDPLAGRLFSWRHGARLRAQGTVLQHHLGDGLAALPAVINQSPQTLFWFDNVLGQLRFLEPDAQRVQTQLRQLRRTLRRVAWGSVHDRLSGPASAPAGFVMPAPWMDHAGRQDEDAQTQAWLHKLHAVSPWGDHLTREVFPAGTPTLNLGWAIHPSHHHWLEAGWVLPAARA